MPRLAGNNPGYRFTMMKHNYEHGGKYEPTDYYFEMPSVTTIIKDTLGIPASAMSWYGFRLGLGGIADVLSDPEAAVEAMDNASPEYLEGMLKAREVSPNVSLGKAGERGNAAHYVLECLADGKRDEAESKAADETRYDDTRYGEAVIGWWDSRDGFADHDVVSERPVWSLQHNYSGTLDLAVRRNVSEDAPAIDKMFQDPWGIWDLKTHKPASGFTKPGFGPAYISDLIQIAAYAGAWEEMAIGPAIPGGIVIARETGKWLEDTRWVDVELFHKLCEVYAAKKEFEGGTA